jgi:hypothetical protein
MLGVSKAVNLRSSRKWSIMIARNGPRGSLMRSSVRLVVSG